MPNHGALFDYFIHEGEGTSETHKDRESRVELPPSRSSGVVSGTGEQRYE